MNFCTSERWKSLSQIIFRLGVSLFTLTPFFLLISTMVTEFLKCPNRDFLGWDPVARFQISLGFADAIRNFQLLKLLIGFLDSPTWPSLRSLAESILILLFGTDSLISIFITLATFLFLGVVSAYILFRELDNCSYKNVPIVCFSIVWFCFIVPYQSYIFSGMLEIQGAFFLLLSVYFLKRVKMKPYFFFISFLGLLQTKYPYAILFCIALLAYIPLKIPMKKYVIYLLQHYRKYSYRNPVLLFLPVPVGTITLVKLGLFTVPGKLYGYMIYFTALLILIHGTHFLYLHRHYTQKRYPDLYVLIYWCMLATGWYLTIHPDRFLSTFSTIYHEQKEGEIFFYFAQILEDIPYYKFLIGIFLLLKISFIFSTYRSLKRKEKFLVILKWEFYKFTKENPYLLIGIFTVIFQSILTSNQQARHIYHVYPLLQIGMVLEIYRLYKPIRKFYLHKESFHKMISWLLPLFFVFLLILILVQNRSINVCYAGSNEDVREVPLFIRSVAERYLEKSTILLNDIDKNHINKPDSELEISAFAYQKKLRLLIAPKHLDENLQEYDLVRISFECNQRQLESYIRKYNPDSTNEKHKILRISNPSGKGCWEQVKFTH